MAVVLSLGRLGSDRSNVRLATMLNRRPTAAILLGIIVLLQLIAVLGGRMI